MAPPGEEPSQALRLGSVVEVVAGPAAAAGGAGPQLGQLVSFSEEDGTYEVCLTTGSSLTVAPADIRPAQGLKRPGRGGGPESFDVLIGPRLDQELLGEEVAACLFEKGFCVLRTCRQPGELSEAVEGMRRRARSGKLHRLPEEVEEGYLGAGGRGKVAWMDPASVDAPKEYALERSDAFLSTIAALLQPYCPDILGKFVTERTPALASLSLLDDEEPAYPPQEADDAALGDFLRTWRRSQIRMVHFLGPAAAQVVLELNEEGPAEALPYRQDVVEISAVPNTILLLRSGLFTYSCRADEEFLSVSATLLEHAEPLVLSDLQAADALVLAGSSGPPGPPGEQVNVVNMACRLMANWDEVEGYRAGLVGGCDSGVEIPLMRWDVNLYYNPDDATRAPGQTYLKHQSYVEGLELFDNKYFEISANEARVMDPMQRHILEVGAQCLAKMGITKKTASRQSHHAGCSVGLDKDDWDKSCAELYGCQGGINVQAIISNRFSFMFNLRGPNYVADTACSASLAATHLAKFALQDREIEKLEFHVALGIHQCLLPWGFEGMGAKMQWGRCFTFNESANGYMRGDGCSGMTLKWGDLPQERDAVWRGSRVGQNGRSATLTAPNGIAQEEVILKTIREAGIRPPESCLWNCHGTGTSLGDPIEVGGIRRVQIREPRTSTLLVLTNKTHTGHLEGGAAMTTLIAAVYQIKSGVSAAICHFRVLNPNLEQSQFSMVITNEVVSSNNMQNNVHVSSFGFGGTNAHAILWGNTQYEILDVPALFMRRLRKMAPPEVRVNGDDPSMWEWDGPDEIIKPGDQYTISLNPNDPEDAAVRWTKEEEAQEPDDGEDDFYCVTGTFNDWDIERMEDGSVTGLRTVTLPVPASGALQFRFLKNGEEDQVLYPEHDRCSRMTAAVLGPSAEDSGREKHTWHAQGVPGGSLRIELFICRGRRSVLWLPA